MTSKGDIKGVVLAIGFIIFLVAVTVAVFMGIQAIFVDTVRQIIQP